MGEGLLSLGLQVTILAACTDSPSPTQPIRSDATRPLAQIVGADRVAYVDGYTAATSRTDAP